MRYALHHLCRRHDRRRCRSRRGDVGCVAVSARVQAARARRLFRGAGAGSASSHPRAWRCRVLPTAAYFQQVVASFGFSSSAALLVQGTTDTVGLTHAELVSVARRADVLVNISGMLTDSALLEGIGRRVYLDLDPGFNQAWHSKPASTCDSTCTRTSRRSGSRSAARSASCHSATEGGSQPARRSCWANGHMRDGWRDTLHDRGQLAIVWLAAVRWPVSR